MNGKQLKNSILQWAIQGKLVPQDPNDEPASVLLERIRAEKARLVKEKKIKKDPTGGILLSDLNWVENPDILARVGERPDKPLTIGFAAETAEGASLTAFAREKCFRKHAAFIVANDARQALESKANCIQLVSLTSAIPFGPADKFACAQFILTEAAKQLSGNAGGTAAPSEK